MKKIILVGPPNSGKGTLTAELLAHKAANVVSASALLFEIAKDNQEINNYIQAGKLVPAEIVIPHLIEKIKAIKGLVILDGFPRDTSQAEAYIVNFTAEETLVVHLPIDDESCYARSKIRRICASCGLTQVAADKCISCPCIDLLTRPDDARIVTRLDEYRQKTEPIVELLEKHYKVINVDASIHPKNYVYEIIREI